MKVAPTQQVTVNPTLQAGGGGTAGLGLLAKKIDELIKSQQKERAKTKQRKIFSAAKKQYSQYRKKAMGAAKEQNKEIKKRESDKIKKMPVSQRVAARKKLSALLKERLNRVKKQLPARVSSPGELTELLKRFRRATV